LEVIHPSISFIIESILSLETLNSLLYDLANDEFATTIIINKMGTTKKIIESLDQAIEIINSNPEKAKKALEKVLETDSTNKVANTELGAIYYSDAQYQEALPLLKKAYSQSPETQLALRIGISYKHVGDADSAIWYLEKAFGDPAEKPTAETISHLAQLYYEGKRWSKLTQFFQKYAPTTVEQKLWHANAQLQLPDTSAAITAFQQAIEQLGDQKDQTALQAREQLGRLFIAQKRYSEADKQIDFIYKANPTFASIHQLRAEVAVGSGKIGEAISAYEQLTSSENADPAVFAQLAQLYEKNNQTEKAQQSLQRLLTLRPQDPQVFLALGRFSFEAENYADAYEKFSQAVILENSRPGWLGKAQSAMKLDKVEAALDAARSALNLDPDNPVLFKIMAWALVKKNMFAEARAYAEQAVKADADNTDVLKLLASIYKELKLSHQLAEIDQKLHIANPKDPESLQRLARYYDQNGQSEKALEYYRSFSDLEPKNTEAARRSYEIALVLQKDAVAESYIQRYLKLESQDAEAHRDAGLLFYRAQKMDKALASFQKALQIDPAISGFYKEYAEVVMQAGQEAEMISAFTKLVESGQADATIYRTLGSVYAKQKQYARSLSVLKDGLKKYPSNTALLGEMGSVYAEQGNTGEAILAYEQAVMLNPSESEIFRQLGELYRKKGEREQAVTMYEKFIAVSKPEDDQLSYVGSFYYDKKDWQKTTHFLSKVQSDIAQSFNHQLMLAQAYFHLKNYEQSITLLEGLLKRNPRQSLQEQLLAQLAEALEKSGKNISAASVYKQLIALSGRSDADVAYKQAYLQEKVSPQQAMDAYQKNMKVFPDDYRNFFRFGVLLVEVEEAYKDAIEYLQRAISLNDTIAQAYVTLAQCYEHTEQPQKQLEAYMAFSRQNPQHFETNKKIGLLLMEKGQLEEAMVYLETANSLQQGDPAVLRQLGYGYIQTGRKPEAVGLLVKAKDHFQDDLQLRYELFRLYRDLNRFAQAEKEMLGLLELKSDPALRMDLARLYFQNEFDQKGLQQLNTILSEHPTHKGALLAKGIELRRMGDLEGSLTALKTLVGSSPDFAEGLYQRAMTHMQMARPKWAETFLKRAIQIDPDMAKAYLNLARVYKSLENSKGYKDNLTEAQKLAPEDPDVIAELQNQL